jgi:NitT/TauT family transport system ATP-binding protein
MNALELEHVSRDFATPDGRVYRALDEISLAVPAGAFVAIVGPSGCGKSTLLNIAAGLLPPTAGVVRVAGEPLDGLNRHATYMFQQDALLPWKTVRDNVALGLTLGGVARAAGHARADAWLTRVGLDGFAAHYPAQLSGGMRKRVAMAQNWMLDRGMVLMDEPFSALDIHTRQRMETELLDLWEGRSAESLALPDPGAGAFQASGERNAGAGAFQASDERDAGARAFQASDERDAGARAFQASGERKTVIFVTHDLEEAIALADEVVILSAGPAARVVAQHHVALDRPRDLMELRTTPAFVDLYRSIWAVLREEVIKSQRDAGVRRG